MTIGIIGSGKIGLSLGVLFEKQGHKVLLHDIDKEKLFKIENKKIDFEQVSLQIDIINSEKLSTIHDLFELINQSEIIFCCIDTPIKFEKEFDTQGVFKIVNEFNNCTNHGVSVYHKKFVIISNLNVGETNQIQEKLNMFNVQVAYCPFILENNSYYEELQNLNLFIVGTDYQDLSNDLVQIFSEIQKTNFHSFVVEPKTAEIVILLQNFLKISEIVFSNFISELYIGQNKYDQLGIIKKILGLNENNPYGFGGKYLSENIKVFSHFISKINSEINLCEILEKLNREHLFFIKNFCTTNNPNKSIPVILERLSYKKESDDLINSPYMELCIELLEEGYTVHVIESDVIKNKLSDLSASFDNRLKFFKTGTKPDGFKINI